MKREWEGGTEQTKSDRYRGGRETSLPLKTIFKTNPRGVAVGEKINSEKQLEREGGGGGTHTLRHTGVCRSNG